MRHSKGVVGVLTAMWVLFPPGSQIDATDVGEIESTFEVATDDTDDGESLEAPVLSTEDMKSTLSEEDETETEAKSTEVDSKSSGETESVAEGVTEIEETSAEDTSLKHCIVIASNENIGTNAFFPEIPLIAGYTADDRPVDEDGNLIYGWGQEELGYSFKFFGEDGTILYQSNQNELATARTKGTGHISLYLNYPDAGTKNGTFRGASLYFHFTSRDTHLEYAFEVPYLSKNADIRIPVGSYEKCYVTASEGVTLPEDYFFPSTCFVQSMKNSHMDFFASTIQLSSEIEFLVNGINSYEETIALGAADPMQPTAPPVETTAFSAKKPTAEGLLDRLQSKSNEEKKVNLAAILAIAVVAFIIIIILMSCIYGMYMYRDRRKEKRNAKKNGNNSNWDDESHSSDNGNSNTGGRG